MPYVSPICTFAATILLLAPAVAGAQQEPAAPEIVSLEKIWDAGDHNAFTDLIRFNDVWFCTFREAQGHVKGDGKIRVIKSADGTAWESAALISEEGIDLRDPKTSITPDGRLMIVAGGSVYDGEELKGRRPRVLFSANGADWTAPQPVVGDWDWLWRVTWHDGRAYGVAYNIQAADEWRLTLYASGDGVHFEPVTKLEVGGQPNETTLRFMPTGEMVALVRREAGNKMGWIGVSRPPYTDWEWNETGHQLGGPNFIVLPDGAIWAGHRSYPGGAKTVLSRMTLNSLEPALTLPSGGDTSYPGFVWHDGLLWMSYYASHEGKTSVYLAKIRM